MAGDWIKIEKASANKPEALKIARMLGIPRREAFGLLVEFWCWLDDNCVDGVVDGVVDADVDALLSCPGLSALLKLVGWVEFDDDKQQLRVTNFTRHNGETSKNRALKSERQAKWRDKTVDAYVDATPSTREEKRREEKKETKESAPARKRATPLPEDFVVSERVKVWAAAKGHGKLDQHLEAFIGKARANGYTYIDWDDALMNCIREDWGKVNSAKPVLSSVPLHASQVPARLPDPHTDMPDDARAKIRDIARTLGKEDDGLMIPEIFPSDDWAHVYITSGSGRWVLRLNVNEAQVAHDKIGLFLAHHAPAQPDDEPELITGESSL